MTRRDWGKIGAGFTFLALLFASLAYVDPLPMNLDEAQRYFLITTVLVFGEFVYFEFFKRY